MNEDLRKELSTSDSGLQEAEQSDAGQSDSAKYKEKVWSTFRPWHIIFLKLFLFGYKIT